MVLCWYTLDEEPDPVPVNTCPTSKVIEQVIKEEEEEVEEKPINGKTKTNKKMHYFQCQILINLKGPLNYKQL